MTDVKSPIPLVIRNPVVEPDDKIVAWACGTCGRVHQNESNATHCHGIRKCEDCGVELPQDRSWIVCDTCRSKHEAAREKERFEKAEKLTPEEYQKSAKRDVVYCENVHADAGHGDMGENYWSSIDELACACEDAGVPLPDYVYACIEHTPHSDAQNIIENALEDTYEDALDDVPDAQHEALQKFLDTWWRATGIVYYSEDPERVVILKSKGDN